MKNCSLILSLLLTAGFAAAQVPAEMEGMEYETRADGTFLIGGPTFAVQPHVGHADLDSA